MEYLFALNAFKMHQSFHETNNSRTYCLESHKMINGDVSGVGIGAPLTSENQKKRKKGKKGKKHKIMMTHEF
jgi:hypothetical protein